ncbi:MAG: hypothetical protein ACKO2N_09655 [Tabrizicola sp.]
MRVCLALLLLLSGPAQAQEMCAAEAVGEVPSCMVGTWTGENDMADRLDQMLARLGADASVMARADSGRYLFIRIGSDGSFITSPMSAAADVTIFSDESFIGEFETNLAAAGGTGLFFAAPGEAMTFCTRSGGWGIMSIEGEGGAAAAPVRSTGSGFTPPMRYSCAEDSLQMFVDLPPPMGTVTYDLTRIPASAIPPEFEALFD